MTPYVDDTDFTLYVGDVREVLAGLPAESVHCVVTSPPYWGLRDYGTGSWVGGDDGCDHTKNHREMRTLKAGNGKSEGALSWTKREDQPYNDVCGKCGARRVDHQLGLEQTPEEYVANMVAVFREVRRVLRSDGTCWLNIGSSYNSNAPGGMSGSTLTKGGTQPASSREVRRRARPYDSGSTAPQDSPDLDSACSGLCDEHLADFLSHRDRTEGTLRPPSQDAQPAALTVRDNEPPGSASASPAAVPPDAPASTTLESWLRLRGSCSRCDKRAASLSDVRSSSGDAPASVHTSWLNYTSRLKPKDMVPIPWMVAMALQEDGWYLRADVIWSKPNPMPESVTDRPTKAHEYLFLLTRSPRYHFDNDAIREPNSEWTEKALAANWERRTDAKTADERKDAKSLNGAGLSRKHGLNAAGRNKRSVWEIATQPYPDAHFATFPQALVEPCVLAGCPEGGVVLDPFMGSGTTALVARRHGRRSVGVELNETYAELAATRLQQLSLLAEPA